jgi:hypothetical protein
MEVAESKVEILEPELVAHFRGLNFLRILVLGFRCAPPQALSLGLWSQYHPRERVDHRLNPRIDLWAHPLTQVVLTSSLEVGSSDIADTRFAGWAHLIL